MILHALLLAFAASGLTAILRALAPIRWRIRRPLSCHLCMSFWCSLVALGLLSRSENNPWHWTAVIVLLWASVGGSVLLLEAIDRFRAPSIEPPDPDTPFT
jgi:hypothetical protein